MKDSRKNEVPRPICNPSVYDYITRKLLSSSFCEPRGKKNEWSADKNLAFNKPIHVINK